MLCKEPILVISNDKIDLSDLPSLPRIDYQPDPALIMLIDNWWKAKFPTPPRVSMKVDHMEIAKKMVASGLGYSILPGIVLEDHDRFHTIHLMTRDGEPLMWPTWLLYRKQFLQISMVRAFVKFMTESFGMTESV
ncbi:substrate-binding domain-containing protein [Paenibacillus hamazuiensis]|uniref:substrate-binding domain-containing protein n=1 Tax=Paenibacillus hamazuiensis TaxID=2936508 RepID=UPI00200CE0B9|nr:substrate-binding domain-containing protein [Paenibacillus hamazuiensis]